MSKAVALVVAALFAIVALTSAAHPFDASNTAAIHQQFDTKKSKEPTPMPPQATPYDHVIGPFRVTYDDPDAVTPVTGKVLFAVNPGDVVYDGWATVAVAITGTGGFDHLGLTLRSDNDVLTFNDSAEHVGGSPSGVDGHGAVGLFSEGNGLFPFVVGAATSIRVIHGPQNNFNAAAGTATAGAYDLYFKVGSR